jgi:hypothetical protein
MLSCGAPHYVLLRCPKFVTRLRSSNFDRCHSFLLTSSAPGGARKRPHFDISPYESVVKKYTYFLATRVLYHKQNSNAIDFLKNNQTFYFSHSKTALRPIFNKIGAQDC